MLMILLALHVDNLLSLLNCGVGEQCLCPVMQELTVVEVKLLVLAINAPRPQMMP